MIFLPLPQQQKSQLTGAKDLTANEYYEWLQEKERKKKEAAEAKQRRIKEHQQKKNSVSTSKKRRRKRNSMLKSRAPCKQLQDEATASSVCHKLPTQGQLVNKEEE